MMRSVSAFCSVTVNASMGTKIGAGTATGVVGGATKVVGCGVWPGAPGAPGVPGAPTWPGFWPTASDTLAPLGGGCMRCVMNQVAPALAAATSSRTRTASTGRRMRPRPPERVGSVPRAGMVEGFEVAILVSMRVCR